MRSFLKHYSQSLLGTRSSVVFFLLPEIPIHLAVFSPFASSAFAPSTAFPFQLPAVQCPPRFHLTFTWVSCLGFLCLVTPPFLLASTPVRAGRDTGRRRTSSQIGPTGVFGWPSWCTATQSFTKRYVPTFISQDSACTNPDGQPSYLRPWLEPRGCCP